MATELSDVPLLFNMVEGGKTPLLSLTEIAELGFAIVLLPISTLLAATKAMQTVLRHIKDEGTPVGVLDDLLTFDEFTDTIGLPEIGALEHRFGTRADSGPSSS